MTFSLKAFDFWRRKVLQDLRDAFKGPYYELEGMSFLVPMGAPPGERRSLARGQYEAPERALLKTYLPKDCPVIELGGSYGIVSNTIRRQLDADVTLVIVEANESLIGTCAHNVSLAGDSAQTRLVHAALGYSESGVVEFALGSGHHNSKVAVQGEGGLPVRAVTLEGLLAQYVPDGSFSLICDIEGAELELLRREQAVMVGCRCLVLEVHPDAFAAAGTSLEEVEGLILSCGLTIVERQENVIAAIRLAEQVHS